MNVEYVLCELETVQFSVRSIFNMITGIAEWEERHEGGLRANQQVPITRCQTNKARVMYVSSIGSTTLVGFRPAQLSLSILSRKVLQSAVASGTSNPQLGGEPVI
jgi:hypothetical protein